MKINNDKFNKWLGEEKDIIFSHIYTEYYNIDTEKIPNDTELIGVMTIWLLDNGCELRSDASKNYWVEVKNGYYVKSDHVCNIDLFTCLKEAIEGMQE